MIEIKPICRFKLRSLAPGAQEFYASSKFLRKFEIDKFVTFWKNMIESGMGTIIAAFDEGEPIGAIGGLAYPDPYSGEMTVQEFFWFVRPEHRGPAGLRLYFALEKWAKEEKGATVIRMAHLTDSMPEKLTRVYTRLGFEHAETVYSKDLVQ